MKPVHTFFGREFYWRVPALVRAETADEVKRVAKTTNYDPRWKPVYDKFRLSEFRATQIDRRDGMETGCSLTFG